MYYVPSKGSYQKNEKGLFSGGTMILRRCYYSLLSIPIYCPEFILLESHKDINTASFMMCIRVHSILEFPAWAFKLKDS